MYSLSLCNPADKYRKDNRAKYLQKFGSVYTSGEKC